jgi:hypothetical protein
MLVFALTFESKTGPASQKFPISFYLARPQGCVEGIPKGCKIMGRIFLGVLTLVIGCLAWQFSRVFRRVVKVALAVALAGLVIGAGAWWASALKERRENDTCRAAAHDPTVTGCNR